jgi:hypothetical protein
VAIYFTAQLMVIVAAMLPQQLHCTGTKTAVLLNQLISEFSSGASTNGSIQRQFTHVLLIS